MADLLNPSADLLRLGAGQLFFDRGFTGAFRHLGNVDTLEPTTTPDIITRRSSMTHTRPIRKRLARQMDVVWRAVGDEWNSDNLALMMMGDVVYATAAATPVAAKILYADVPTGTLGSVLGGKYFYVGDLNIGTVSMDLGATALDSDDFEVFDAHMGLVRIKETSTTATNATDDLTVDYTPQAITGLDSPVVRGGNSPFIEGAMLFIEDNTAGLNHIWRAWNASVAPDGAFGLISDDWATFALNFTLQDDSDGLHGGSVSDPLYHSQLVPALTP